MNCGPKSFRWVMQQEGKSLTLESARGLCQTTTMGTREPDLSAAFRSLGYSIELRQPIAWDALNDLCKQYFVVVMYQCHYSVIVSADTDSVSLYDPDWNQVVRRARADFEPMWNDYEIDLDWTRRDYDRAAILVPRGQTDSKAFPLEGSAATASQPGLVYND